LRLPLTLYLIALAVRAITGWLHPDPAYTDSTYYVGVARSLAAGHGFTVDFIWSFVDVGGHLPAVGTLPIPSNAHWMPLASLIQVPFLVVFGTSALAALVPFMLIGATAAPLTWAIARDAGLGRDQALVAGLMSAVPGGLTPFLGQPDNFALFMPLGALALWLCSRGLRGDARAFALGGLVVGVATLARNDGVLLGVPFALGWLAQWWPRRTIPGTPLATDPNAEPEPTAEPEPRGARRRLPLATAVGCALFFLAAMGPWYARQLAVFGSLSPSASSGRILWITDYKQLFSVAGDPTLASFLSQGWGPLLLSRVSGFVAAVTILGAVPFLFFLVPFILWAAWARRSSILFRPWFLYGAVLLALSGLLFAVHVPYGTFLHSAVALVPHGYVLAIEGIGLAVAWVARRRRHWDVPRATWTFSVVALLTLSLGAGVGVWKADRDWGADADVRRAAGVMLAGMAAPADRLMTADPGAFRYYAGLGGIVTPADPLPVVETAARAYDISWLVLERAHIVDSLAPVYLGTVPLPPWLAPAGDGPLVIDVGGDTAGNGAGLAAFRIFAVCLSLDDPRAACANAR
jgi:hypothetical protein